MKHPSYSRVVDILRERETELFAIRSNFDQLQNKFFQLENAFETNLRVQRRLESELELRKFGKAGEKSTTNHVDELEKENVKARTALSSHLTKVRVEKQRWKDAYFHQKKIADRQKLEHEHSIANIQNECEKILKTCRESGEKHFRELQKLYEDSNKKARHFKEAHDASQARASSTGTRIHELANLLETIVMFRGVKTEAVCQRAAEALRSLATEGEQSYEQAMKLLRQVTWNVDENDENNETLEIVRQQNSALRQIVKSLKRRLQEKCRELSRTDENTNEITVNDTARKSSRVFEKNESLEKSENSSENRAFPDQNTVENYKVDKEETTMRENEKTWEENENGESSKIRRSRRAFDERSNPTNEIPTIIQNYQTVNVNSKKSEGACKRIYVEAFESHRNGIPYEEYTFFISEDRRFRIRHPKTRTSTGSTMIVEFVNSEKDFDEATVDRTIFYLGDNVEKIWSINDLGVHCGVQTNRAKTMERSVQTTMTSKSFSRVNAGAGILNSEKRAMERSLMNLECTVASLKTNALGQARSIIKNDVKVLGDEFFNYLERLERSREKSTSNLKNNDKT